MSISILCPKCSAPVTAPDSAAGRRAKCPKCAAVMVLPSAPPDVVADNFELVDEDFEVVDDEPKPVKRKKPRVALDEEDDEEDERPRKKKRGKEKRTQARSPAPLVIGGGLVLLLLIAGGLYLALRGGSSSGTSSPPPVVAKGPNWVPFTAPDGSFSAAFLDGAPTAETLESLAAQASGANAAKPEDIAKASEALKQFGITMEGWSRTASNRKFVILIMSVPPAMAAMANPDQIIKQGTQQGGKILTQSDFEAGIYKGKQFTSHNPAANKWVLARVGTTIPGKLVFLTVEAPSQIEPTDAEAQQFFEKFQWKQQ